MVSLTKMNKVYIGPAGWSYKDWEGIVYPTQKEKNFDQLAYLAQFFNVIEINSSFYRPPAVRTVAKWVQRVNHNPGFKFTYKLWQAYTHERDQFPGDDEDEMVKSGLEILKTNERLGALLIQFPWSFKNTPENLAWMQRIIHTFVNFHPVVEIRHSSWNNEKFFNFLNDSGAAFANIDQPVIGDSIGLTSYASRQISYLRLHGRNKKNWFAKNATVASRYDYLYAEDELKDIIQAISRLIETSPKTFIIFNNHFRGQAVVNALQSKFLLEGKVVDTPAESIETYPQLRAITKSIQRTPRQVSLF